MLLATSLGSAQLNKPGFKMWSMAWRATGQADNARYVIGCHLTHETRDQIAVDDVAGNIGKVLPNRPT
jgi:hypothetical protein